LQQANFLTLTYRMFRILLHLIVGLCLLASVWSFSKKETRLGLIQWWSKKLIQYFGVQLITHGELPEPGTSNTMFLANHVSWIDIYVLNSIIPLQFIAKSEINTWPVFGYLARKSGTIFINRANRKDTSRIVGKTTEQLLNGGNIGFFPEGTTTDGTVLGPFKGSIVQAAINAQANLQPVAIRYPLPNGGINTQMAYAGDTTMGESMMYILKQKQSVVELHFLAPIKPGADNRQTLIKTTRHAIASTLNL